MNSEIRILLQYWNFRIKRVDEAWCLLERIAWDLFEFEKASYVSRYFFSNLCAFYARSYNAVLWCDMYNSSDHNITSCPHYACYAQPDFASLKGKTDLVLTLHESSLSLIHI